MKYGFVYLWYDKKHKRYYLGSHWGSEYDYYICSSKWMRDAYRRRKRDFKRRILKRIYTTRDDLIHEEYRWLSFIHDDELGKKYYNLKKTLQGFGEVKNKDEWIQKRSNSRARDWRIQHPDGTVEVIHNLKKFCRDNSISYNNMHRLTNAQSKARNRMFCQGYRLLEKV